VEDNQLEPHQHLPPPLCEAPRLVGPTSQSYTASASNTIQVHVPARPASYESALPALP